MDYYYDGMQNVTTVRVTDYTRNEAMPMESARGPAGMVMKFTVWGDGASQFAQSSLEKGCYYQWKNVRAKIDHQGFMEGKINDANDWSKVASTSTTLKDILQCV